MDSNSPSGIESNAEDQCSPRIKQCASLKVRISGVHTVWLDFLYFPYEQPMPDIPAGKQARDGEENQTGKELLGLTGLLPKTSVLAFPDSPNLGEEADWRVGSEGKEKGCGGVNGGGSRKQSLRKTKVPSLFLLLCFPQELTVRLKVQEEESSKQDDLGSIAEIP